jgi:hypothetical protein
MYGVQCIIRSGLKCSSQEIAEDTSCYSVHVCLSLYKFKIVLSAPLLSIEATEG